MSSVAIRAERLGKDYKLFERPADRLLELFLPSRRHRRFAALEDISFEVPEGETIGLIGENGAGKSTLLKLLCGITAPTSGSLEIEGSLASILELGAGFHPEFTGRDNAALNAAILGLSPSEIRRQLPKILDFSELGEFLDRPVKTYSTGMYMRLAFSVAVNIDPDILVVDEALAVGDGHFQKKCVDRIREFQQQRKTIFFCSHALYYISTLCNRAIWLDHGSLRMIGRSVDVVHAYETFLMKQDRELPAPSLTEDVDSPVRIRAIEVEDASGRTRHEFDSGDDIVLRMTIEATNRLQPIHLMVGVLRAADEMQCFAVGTHADGRAPVSGSHWYDVAIALRNVPLLRGDYAVVIYAGDESAMHVFDRRDLRPAFSMRGDNFEVGLISVVHDWSVAQHVDAAAR